MRDTAAKIASYDFTSRFNHWLVAVAMIGMLA
jgi:cytochrome b subunit of formate dehydrogenase